MHDYEEALNAVREHAKQGKRVWIDPNSVNFAFANVVAKDRYAVDQTTRFLKSPIYITLVFHSSCRAI